MSKNLIVVESPAKARTITKYLGKDFTALASYGHVRDLRPKDGAVDTEHGFAMHYAVIDRNRKHVDAIAREMVHADTLYLATDPDREGEAISWHLYELLKERRVLGDKPVHRVVFHEITRKAIQDAIELPRPLSANLVNAQQARRALDYLVGFNLSPLLWKKLRRGLSAGRVQSPALRLICEREAEIERFEAREYWTIEADLEAQAIPFVAKLSHFDAVKLEQFSVTDHGGAAAVVEQIEAGADGHLTVTAVEKKQRRRNPAPPFTTSTLQQEASRKLGFGTQRTMRLAQQLYEGIDLGGESVGLISYMRTDSVNLAAEAIDELRTFIAGQYGADYVPVRPQAYKNRSKNAQEAHEAVRPTAVARTPESVKSALDRDQFRLYELIWKRAVACQMVHATLDTVAVDLSAGTNDIFRATGSTIRHPGFMTLYLESGDDRTDDPDAARRLPELTQGQRVVLHAIRPEQHFTEPPPRYTEASLVKTLEAYGIGRPSTYASIISTLLAREYVELESRRFTPTEIGKVVNRFLTSHFARYVDYDFTARLEDELDAVSRGEQDWVPLLERFWRHFEALLREKENISRDEASQARELGVDPSSGRPVAVRMGRYGPFVQIGSKDDEDKPRFAGLRPGQKIDSIELAAALDLFKLPCKLGATESGEPVSANIGRFGPYIRYGDKYVSLKEDDPHTIALPRALELIRLKQEQDASRIIRQFEATDVQVLNGRYGPYITDGQKNARVPKDQDPQALDLAQCLDLLAAAPARRARAGKKKTVGKPAATARSVVAGTASRKKTQRKVSKRKVSKRKVSKRKVSKRKVSKRKVSKRKVSKRKVSKRKVSKRKVSKRKVSKRKVSKRKVSKRKVSKRKVSKRKVSKRKPG